MFPKASDQVGQQLKNRDEPAVCISRGLVPERACNKNNDPQSKPAELLRYCGDYLVIPKSRYSPTGTNTNPYAAMHTNIHMCAQAIN